MATNIFVGHLPFSATADAICALFSVSGTVASVHRMTDHATGRLRGFGFMDMGTAHEASAAIAGPHGADLSGRSLTVNAVRPRANQRRRCCHARRQ